MEKDQMKCEVLDMKKNKMPKTLKLDGSVEMQVYENNLLIQGNMFRIHISRKHCLRLSKFLIAADKYFKEEIKQHKKTKKQ